MWAPSRIKKEQIKDFNQYKEFTTKNAWEDDSTSLGRFRERIQSWMQQPNGYLEHHLWWVLHNCVAHPVLGLAPCKETIEFHDWASKKLNQHVQFWQKNQENISSIPVIKNRAAWIKHNILAHIGIGLFPCLKTFHYHDLTALEMDVDGWQ